MSNKQEERFVIYADTNKCKGCRKCELACIASHNNMTIKEAVKHRAKLASRVHVIKSDTIKLPVQCRQCEDAPCVLVCPTDALAQDATGQVVMRAQYCAGCALCLIACPYGAIQKSFIALSDEEKIRLERSDPRVVAVRCDLCKDWRIKEGKKVSACVEACPGDALTMISVEEYRKVRAGEALRLAEDFADDDDDNN